MRRIHAPLSLLGVFLILSTSAFGQTGSITIEQPHGRFGFFTNAYRQRTVSPINLTNSGRLEQLVRAGNLYLSAADVVDLAIENNLDIEVQRYGPFLADEVLRRAEGGGILRSVGTAIAPGPTSVSSAGVGSVGNLSNSVASTSGSGIISQIGPAIPNLDPQMSALLIWGHTSTPQSNTFVTRTSAVVTDSQTYNFGYSQGFLTGTNFAVNYSNSVLKQNIITNLLNPQTNASLDLQISQNLLQGFGLAVNNRNIRVAKNNRKISDLQFKAQLITTISAVLNVYWDLVAFDENVRVAQQTLTTAEKLYSDNKKQVEIGTLAPIEVTRAAAEVATDQQNLLIAETNVLQQETVLKNALSKNGVSSPTIAEVRVIPLDRIQVPEKENIAPLTDLVQEAIADRPEIQQDKINIESSKINLVGSKNSLRPSLAAFAEFTQHGLTGQANTAGLFGVPDPYFVGGYGNAVGQIFRRNFPDYAAGFSLTIPLRNRAAQADYVTDQLNLRQSELQMQKALNQVRVDVQNAVIGVQQARAGYEASVKARLLQQETLDAEQKKYQLGASTVLLVIQAQRDLTTSQGSEVQALANYTHAKIALSQALGRTLEENNITVSEALSGRVARESSIPAKVPTLPDQDGAAANPGVE